jgi:hypothetical protein
MYKQIITEDPKASYLFGTKGFDKDVENSGREMNYKKLKKIILKKNKKKKKINFMKVNLKMKKMLIQEKH